MPYPQNGTETPRLDLARTLMELDLSANVSNMVALEVFPIQSVQATKGEFGRMNRKQLMGRTPGLPATSPGYEYRRAPRSAYAKDDTSFTTDKWETEEFGLTGLIDRNEANAYQDYFTFETVVTARVANQLLTSMEQRVAAACFDTTVFTTVAGKQTNVATVAAEQWSNQVTATPIRHVKDAKLAMYDQFGMMPNAMVMNAIAFEHLISTDDIRARITAQGAGSPDRNALITRQMVAQCFGVEQLIVATSVYDANNPNQVFNASPIWGAHAMLFVKSTSLDLAQPSLGRTFSWTEDNSMPNGYVETYYDPEYRGDRVRIRHQLQNKLIDSANGYLLANVYV